MADGRGGSTPLSVQIVIPGRPKGPNPESMNTGLYSWIPGSPLHGAPE
jgi:hypothetical protein